ncbi:uncharacterized protein LOC112346725 [Selaginella moellendorffii]|uniref:uncharacterized protein LOC112346725 n=1 Tax=Selaginella moellendorffii TaxID=88036 RepID=UPI000D1C37B6|nr:uncharacterized protein LOC112346725 [Selaginella moellendorffii]|eukprot:XP_024532040.1 uncharacterized protein LOC112346725 [Selaginella moellendorffii]
MASGWRKARIALGLHVCVSAPHDPDDEGGVDVDQAASPAISPSPSPRSGAPNTSARSPSRLQLLRSSIRLSRSACSICLEPMKPGLGHALFTAECSHTFHFSCIASNVRHGNLVCPVCRARWKEVPWQAPPEAGKDQKLSPRPRRSLSRNSEQEGINNGEGAEVGDEELRRLDPVLRILDESIASARGIRRNSTPEPQSFDDDEPLRVDGGGELSAGGAESSESDLVNSDDGNLEVTCHPEVESICYSESRDDFTVLVHVKALSGNKRPAAETVSTQALSSNTTSRAPIDLVTVLDVSGSMAGTKLLLLKQAMGFVIRNLSPSDRLSVIAFSSTAKRLFPLRRMVEDGKQLALRAIDALVSTGGTNIAEGLKKGAKILDDRRERNPIASIMLLSDGQDTHSLGARANAQLSRGGSFRRGLGSGRHLMMPYGSVSFPVHTFGFGADHDSATMHSIAESSGGTFSFIQAETAVQDAFAQCIGGLLSVVVQDARLCFSTAGENLQVKSVQAGSYERSITDQGTRGFVKLGDLYAEEERDVLLEFRIPMLESPLLSAGIVSVDCSFKDPVLQKPARTRTKTLSIDRPGSVNRENQVVSVQVDRQRNRIRTAETILEAGCLADRGDLVGAQQTLQSAKVALRNSAASLAGDQLSSALESELTEIQVRMANRQMYERSGRAYILSAQSSHFRQRATARGDYVESHSRDYQTPSMVDMILRSQTLTFPLPPSTPPAGATALPPERSSSIGSRHSYSSSRRASGRVHDIGTSL